MIAPDTSIEIIPAGNGWLVRNARGVVFNEGALIQPEDTMVFQSMMELQEFLCHHFRHRRKDVASDSVNFNSFSTLVEMSTQDNDLRNLMEEADHG